MSGDAAVVRFGGLGFPVFVLVDRAAEVADGESFATHYLSGEGGEKLLPLFSTEGKAVAYAAAVGLAGSRAAEIADKEDLLIRLEVFKNRGGTYVGIDLAAHPGEGDVTPDLGSFIDLVRRQL